MLLDLIGAPEPRFFNYFGDTTKWFSWMSRAETALASMREFQNYSYQRPQDKYFREININAGIEDDHIPFLKKSKQVCIALQNFMKFFQFL